MMGSTTRRISQEELRLIKEVQSILKARGVKLSQMELSELIITYASSNLSDLIPFIEQSLKLNSKEDDSIKEFLEKSYRGKEDTDAVIEHDVII